MMEEVVRQDKVTIALLSGILYPEPALGLHRRQITLSVDVPFFAPSPGVVSNRASESHELTILTSRRVVVLELLTAIKSSTVDLLQLETKLDGVKLDQGR